MEYTNFVSLDVSKDKLDYYDFVSGHSAHNNDTVGFRRIIKALPSNCCIVMEATGSYHHLLASFLYERGVAISIVNPLSVKRFI